MTPRIHPRRPGATARKPPGSTTQSTLTWRMQATMQLPSRRSWRHRAGPQHLPASQIVVLATAARHTVKEVDLAGGGPRRRPAEEEEGARAMQSWHGCRAQSRALRVRQVVAS